MDEVGKVNRCAWCGFPVLEENQVILKRRVKEGRIEEIPYHWECVWEAGHSYE